LKSLAYSNILKCGVLFSQSCQLGPPDVQAKKHATWRWYFQAKMN